jgi:hypothetical protein
VTTRPADLRHGQDPIAVRWVKRRWECREPSCPRQTFTESVTAVPPRCRVTARLRGHAAALVADGGRTVAQAAREQLGVPGAIAKRPAQAADVLRWAHEQQRAGVLQPLGIFDWLRVLQRRVKLALNGDERAVTYVYTAFQIDYRGISFPARLARRGGIRSGGCAPSSPPPGAAAASWTPRSTGLALTAARTRSRCGRSGSS